MISPSEMNATIFMKSFVRMDENIRGVLTTMSDAMTEITDTTIKIEIRSSISPAEIPRFSREQLQIFRFRWSGSDLDFDGHKL